MWDKYRIRFRRCQKYCFFFSSSVSYDAPCKCTPPLFISGMPAATNRNSMNGQLSEHPLAELIREISAKRLSGRLRVEQNRIKAVVYFLEGSLVYAACNVRTLRLSEYLQKSKLVSDQQLAGFQDQRSDLALAATLCAQNILDLNTAEQLQVKQVSDILRVALLWTEGTWEFDYRSHLNEQVSFKIDTPTLLLEAGRRIPPKFAASRFRNPKEVISPLSDSTNTANLSAPEGFLLSR